ncbi:MAG: triose-phosphate isomerase, partial [Thermoprotei archaeon]|nr:triose-phosphate isomerase [Thermoprotei archaeon]
MKEGILVINYKSYPSSYGKKALEIAKAAERIAAETGTRIILAVPPTEIRSISSSVGLEVISQHVDPITEGAGT